MLHRLATAYRTVFAKIDLTASDQHAGFALAAALQECHTLSYIPSYVLGLHM